MLIEIGSMTTLRSGQAVYDELKNDEKIAFIFLETGRSDDPFVEKQFGEFGEAAILTIIVDENHQKEIFEKVFNISGMFDKNEGMIYSNKKIFKDSLHQ